MRTFSVNSPLFLVVWLCFILICPGFAEESRSNWATEAYKKNCDSVVFIQGDKVEERRGSSADSERTHNGMGTGIIIDERGYIVTNYHVVKDIRKIQVKTYDEKDYIATLVTKDTDTDLAIIKINPRTPLKPIALGRSNDLMPGEVCIAIGNPYGYTFSLTDGRISAINRDVNVNDSALVYRTATQTNTEINPGNSGGPLINVNGEMIGINVAIRQGANGIAFAIPVDKVVEVAARLLGDIAEQKITLGLTVSQNEPSDYNTQKRFIIRVEAVESNSPAALAGIQKGDILTGIGKYTLRNQLDFYRALLDLKANDEIAFSYVRNNETFDMNVAMGTTKGGVFAPRTVSPQPAAVAPTMASHVTTNVEKTSSKTAEWDRAIWDNLGIQYTPIPKQEFERTFKKIIVNNEAGIDFEGGIIVKAVREGSPAEQARLTTGDVVLTIGQWKTAMANDIRYVGAKWESLQAETESLQTHVIRNDKFYRTEIPMR